jgi:ATP-dependent RNA helicase DeaD
MGREGVAFSFVNPEQGHELTRIEQRINRLLKRDSIPGFYLTHEEERAGRGDDFEEKPAPPKPPNSRRKRYRRAL